MNNNYLLPKYLQIKEMIIDKIEKKEFKTGDKLPSEREISSLYSVSRMTARKALLEVINGGYAFTEAGRGTFVKERIVNNDLTKLEGFSYMVKRSSGKETVSREIEKKIIEADSILSEKLRIPIGTPINEIARCRIVDKDPIAYEFSFTKASEFPGLMEIDFSKNSLFDTMIEKYNRVIVRARQTLEIFYSDKEVSRILQIPKKTALFLFKDVSEDRDGNTVEFCVRYVRADKCHFYNEIKLIN
ncbi:MAG TPA: GntR family transcriptional regulator [Thermotogota bacterium]|nr:GntR family transcriptional regulator [Thermotogota bacterium]HPJ88804.1 GntR family transcriptional regulator [Thermotogota bacterium]HPR97291.1 GntR family transcriptional regulator [Thermotogota bacterium]